MRLVYDATGRKWSSTGSSNDELFGHEYLMETEAIYAPDTVWWRSILGADNKVPAEYLPPGPSW